MKHKDTFHLWLSLAPPILYIYIYYLEVSGGMVSLQGALWLLFFPLVFLYYAIFLGFLGYSFISSLTMKSLSHTIVALSGIVFICTSVYLNVFKST
ncbi:MAG: hypothetical protein OSB62_02505, partial [Alphaproteobacteria bacterium]|nr:hypothetical protein [Alphaproteobacteria bacterium]